MVDFSAVSSFDETSNAAGEAAGPSVEYGSTTIYYTFNISNSTSASVNYDLSCLDSPANYPLVCTSGSMSGSLSNGQSASVSFTVSSPDLATQNNDACVLLQAGSAPLITVNNQPINFWFYTKGDMATKQLIQILASGGFVQTENTDQQCNVTDSSVPLVVGLGGGGNCTTQNICIQVVTSYS